MKVPDVTMDHVLRLDKEVRFLHTSCSLKGDLDRLWEGLPLVLMVVEEDQEGLPARASGFPRNLDSMTSPRFLLRVEDII